MSWSATHQPPKSRLVGLARQANGHPTTAFEALVAQICGQCGAVIAPGQLFSRQTMPRQAATVAHVVTMARAPVCTTCRPLQLEPAP